MASNKENNKEKLAGDPLRTNLDLLVLSVLNDEPRYGYAIQQELASQSGGLLDVKAGTLYPILHRLEAEKLIRAKWDRTTGRGRKWYELTAAGRRRLVHQARQWDQHAQCLRRLLGAVLDPPPRPAQA